MKLNFETLKGTSFEIEASPEESVAEVKKIIETTQGQSVYPADQQMLIYQGKVLKDDTTLESNKVAENSFLILMLSKAKASSSGASTATSAKAPWHMFLHFNESVTPAARVASATTTPACQEPIASSQVSSNTSTSDFDNWDWDWDWDWDTHSSNTSTSNFDDWDTHEDPSGIERLPSHLRQKIISCTTPHDETHEHPSGIERLPSDLLQKIISITSPRDALHIAMFQDFQCDAYSNIVWASFRRSFEESNVERLDLNHVQAIISATPASMTVREQFGLLFQRKVVADQSMTMWLDKKTGTKCYMLLSRTLLGPDQSNWTVIPFDSLRYHLGAAELLPRANQQLEISGTMASTLLSQRSTYAAYMVFKVNVKSSLLHRVHGSVVSIGAYRDSNKICFCSDCYGYCELPQMRRDGWMEIKLGDFRTGDGDDGLLHIHVMLKTGNQVMEGLTVLGIEIRRNRPPVFLSPIFSLLSHGQGQCAKLSRAQSSSPLEFPAAQHHHHLNPSRTRNRQVRSSFPVVSSPSSGYHSARTEQPVIAARTELELHVEPPPPAVLASLVQIDHRNEFLSSHSTFPKPQPTTPATTLAGTEPAPSPVVTHVHFC